RIPSIASKRTYFLSVRGAGLSGARLLTDRPLHPSPSDRVEVADGGRRDRSPEAQALREVRLRRARRGDDRGDDLPWRRARPVPGARRRGGADQPGGGGRDP